MMDRIVGVVLIVVGGTGALWVPLLHQVPLSLHQAPPAISWEKGSKPWGWCPADPRGHHGPCVPRGRYASLLYDGHPCDPVKDKSGGFANSPDQTPLKVGETITDLLSGGWSQYVCRKDGRIHLIKTPWISDKEYQERTNPPYGGSYKTPKPKPKATK